MSREMAGFLVGAAVGLRSFTAPAVVSWAARAGRLKLEHTPLAFLGYRATPYVLTGLAIAELVADKLPQMPSRKSPVGFAARLAMGALSGSALAGPGGAKIGVAAGALGAVVGTLVGYELRTRLASSAGGDLPVALAEDALAIGGSAVVVTAPA